MNLYRITKKEFASLDGIGGFHADSRWNEKGLRVIYLAESRALAILEFLVHIGSYDLMPCDISLLTVETPDAYRQILPGELPANWKTAPKITRTIGSEFLKTKKDLLLRVPSVIVSGEYNYLLNPAHELASRCKITNIEPFLIDSRLML